MQILYGVHIKLQRFQVEKFVIFQIVQLNLGRNGVEAINCVLERAGEAKRKKNLKKMCVELCEKLQVFGVCFLSFYWKAAVGVSRIECC